MSSIEELQIKIKALEELVAKQTKLISRTGEQVLNLQVQSTSDKVARFNPYSLTGEQPIKKPSKFSKHESTEDYATNEDLVQLVGELQGQLDLIEERSIRRLINSNKKPSDNLAPLFNHDGEEPDLSLYPKDIEALIKIEDINLIKLARFYELLPPTQEERSKFEEYLEGKRENPDLEEVEKEIKIDDYSKEELIEAFDRLARFIGVDARRGEDVW
ncbi:hypothetical protein WICMUC_000820 [Wickerhamomyces mucosus]|uniref:Mrp8p n=1 Tax=Wickerhamomyces mucosus TaxID=1378264 RepID=A0A9P8PY44_9ASCO|nr:hypothetical protein WICMUC_000820 [Wickerhamomyces mucosus]